MADIEPYKQIKKTNIQEHNDLVGKINEIINVVNETNLESIGEKFDTIDNQIDTINNTDSLQWADIQTLKTNDPKQDATLNQHTEEIKGLTESLVSDVTIVDGYNMGTFKVRIDREGAISIDSNEYALESPVSIELIQGTGPSMFKCQITLSDGRTLVSNDFVFTTEYIGEDIYISSFTFKAGNVDGTISADIGLSNGVTIEANNFVIPTQPTVANAINDLNTRVESLENTTVSDVRIKAIEDKNIEQDGAIETNATDIALVNTEIATLKNNISNHVVEIDLSQYLTEPSYSASSITSGFSTFIIGSKVFKDKNGKLREYPAVMVGGNSATAQCYKVKYTSLNAKPLFLEILAKCGVNADDLADTPGKTLYFDMICHREGYDISVKQSSFVFSKTANEIAITSYPNEFYSIDDSGKIYVILYEVPC